MKKITNIYGVLDLPEGYFEKIYGEDCSEGYISSLEECFEVLNIALKNLSETDTHILREINLINPYFICEMIKKIEGEKTISHVIPKDKENLLKEITRRDKNYYIDGYVEMFYERYLFIKKIKAVFGIKGIEMLFDLVNSETYELMNILNYLKEN